jgi:GxxExxY protein
MKIEDPLTEAIIGAAMKVRKAMGVGLFELPYHTFLLLELNKLNLRYISKGILPVDYDGVEVKLGYRPDLIVEDRVIVELKTVTAILPAHEAQILTYMRLSEKKVGLLLNMHAVPFSSGIRRFVL